MFKLKLRAFMQLRLVRLERNYFAVLRASFAAGIAAVRRERRKRGKMAAGRDDILEVSKTFF